MSGQRGAKRDRHQGTSLGAVELVSYGSIRRAMEVLRERGLIVTIHGRATFVTDREAPAGSS